MGPCYSVLHFASMYWTAIAVHRFVPPDVPFLLVIEPTVLVGALQWLNLATQKENDATNWREPLPACAIVLILMLLRMLPLDDTHERKRQRHALTVGISLCCAGMTYLAVDWYLAWTAI